MKSLVCLSACLLTAVPVLAADTGPAKTQAFKPLVDLRLRYEGVDQAGIARTADALTLRGRAGIEYKRDAWSVLAEAESTVALQEHYFSGLNGRTQYPLVADPENIELNRLQVQYKPSVGTAFTLGRQRINLDDQRFVGAAAWRANEQTFDAARVEWTAKNKLKLDATYAWRVRTIWGRDGFGARQTAIGGDNLFVNMSYPTQMGTLTGFAYRVDPDEAAISGKRLSSQTLGLRFAGNRPLSDTLKLGYVASYAGQRDAHDNPNDYSADYGLLEATLDAGMLDTGMFKFGIGYESLGADEGVALTSFQTPLATGHKFQGWADKFLTTPANGLRDGYLSAGWSRKQIGKFNSVGVTAVWHEFRSDRLGQDYGDELDLIASAKVEKFVLTAKYADYRADTFATDTRKLWLQVDWVF